MKNRYLDFLCDIVGRTYEYSELLALLHGVEFYSLVPNDDNRAADGELLRRKFIDEGGQHSPSSLPDGACTLLEMLIGLSFRLEFDLMDGPYERSADEWFWVLIDNLGLIWCDNIMLLRSDMCDEVISKCDTFLERKYDFNGFGGLFPLSPQNRDQREVEIWYQMSAWINENFPI